MQPLHQVQMLLMLAVILSLQACGAANPLARAETVEQKAYASYGSFVIAKEQVAKAIQSGELSDDVVLRVAAADRVVTPVADQGLELIDKLETIREEYENCTAAVEVDCETTGDRLLAALSNLNRWILEVDPLITQLRNAAAGGQ